MLPVVGCPWLLKLPPLSPIGGQCPLRADSLPDQADSLFDLLDPPVLRPRHQTERAPEGSLIANTPPEGGQVSQDRGPAQPAVVGRRPAFEDGAGPHRVLSSETKDEGADDVDGQRIREVAQRCRTQEALDPCEVRRAEHPDVGLQQHHRGEPALEHRPGPQLRGERRDVVVPELLVAAGRIADGAADGPDGRSVVLETTAQSLLVGLSALLGAFVMEGLVDEVGGVTHAFHPRPCRGVTREPTGGRLGSPRQDGHRKRPVLVPEGGYSRRMGNEGKTLRSVRLRRWAIVVVVVLVPVLLMTHVLLFNRWYLSPGDAVEAFEHQPDLPVTNPRDITAEACTGAVRCRAAIAADEIAVYQFWTRSAARDFAATLGDNGHQSDWIVLNYDNARKSNDGGWGYGFLIDNMWTSG